MPEVSSTVVETTKTPFAEVLQTALSKLDLADICYAAVLLIICYIGSRILRKFFRRTLERSHLSENLQSFFQQVLRFTLDFIIILIVADSLGIPVTSLLAVFSLLGLALSLSLQNLLGNLISGVVLLFNRPFNVGDYVEINGVEGSVKQVALFQTQFNTIDNKLIYIPNSDVLSSTIINYSAESIRRVDIVYQASYDTPTETVKKAIAECAASLPVILTDPAVEIVVSGFGDNNVDYTIRFWVRADQCILARDLMNDHILSFYQKHGVELSYPRVVIQK